MFTNRGFLSTAAWPPSRAEHISAVARCCRPAGVKSAAEAQIYLYLSICISDKGKKALRIHQVITVSLSKLAVGLS